MVVDALTRVGGSADAVLADLVSGAAWATWAFGDDTSCVLGISRDGVRLDGQVAGLAIGSEVVPTCSSVRPAPMASPRCWCPSTCPGVTVRTLESFDVSRRWGAVDLQGVTLPLDAISWAPGCGDGRELLRQVHLAAVLVAADAVGAMHADFETALQYAKDRIAFGRPIGSFQALKHVIADVSLSVEMAKGIVAEAAPRSVRTRPTPRSWCTWPSRSSASTAST